MAKKSNKSDAPKTKIGRFEKVGGVVTMLPPEDEEPTEKAETEQLVIEKSNGAVMVQSEFVNEDDLQYVIDDSTELQSRKLAEKARQENKERAEKEAVRLSPVKVGNTVVTSTESYSDIDLSVLNADVQIQTTKPSENNKKSKK